MQISGECCPSVAYEAVVGGQFRAMLQHSTGKCGINVTVEVIQYISPGQRSILDQCWLQWGKGGSSLMALTHRDISPYSGQLIYNLLARVENEKNG